MSADSVKPAYETFGKWQLATNIPCAPDDHRELMERVQKLYDLIYADAPLMTESQLTLTTGAVVVLWHPISNPSSTSAQKIYRTHPLNRSLPAACPDIPWPV